MKMDLLIRNAALLDLETGVEMCSDVGIQRGRIVFVQPVGTAQPDVWKELDAAGSYLFPGLIDAHVHLFQHGSGFGMDADRLLSAGVTTAVDMGSAGYANFAAMHQCDLAGKKLRLKSFLNLSPIGQPGKGINEPLGDDVLSIEKMQEMMEQYP